MATPTVSRFALVAIWVVVLALATALLFPMLVNEGPRRSACLARIKECALGEVLYAEQNNERFPPSNSWMDVTRPFVRDDEVFACPDVRKTDPKGYGYAMSVSLGSAKQAWVRNPEKAALIFDSILLNRNACSDVYGLPNPPRYSGNSVAYADGHARRMRARETKP